MVEYVYGTDGHEGHWLTGEEIVRCCDCRYLRELCADMACEYECGYLTLPQWLIDRMTQLGVGVDG